MDLALITNWNSIIQPNDNVYHLGDLAFLKAEKIPNLLCRLNGTIHFIFGNHDKELRKVQSSKLHSTIADKIKFLGDYKEITVNNQYIVLCHYAMRTWNRQHHGSWQLYGHSHGTLPDDPNLLSIDVGVDCHNYFPISFEDIQRIMKKKTWKPIDHHV